MCSGYFQHFYYGWMYCIVLVSEQKDMIIDRKRQKRAVMIRLENVCFAYEKEIALRYVDLHINRGDSIVIQGPNGCGKSTLIKLLNGIIFPSEGKYFYQGQSRRYQFKTEEKVSGKKFYKLACRLQKIIGAPLWEKNVVEGQVCDGCSYELQITYADKRKEIIKGDIAGGTFDSILEKFVHSVFPR